MMIGVCCSLVVNIWLLIYSFEAVIFVLVDVFVDVAVVFVSVVLWSK